MSLNKYHEIEENMKLRNRLLKLGIGCSIVGPKGPKGDKGDRGEAGPVIPSSTEAIFSTGFNETNESEQMIFDTPWLIPNESEFFTQLSDSELEVKPGIYEITMSGLISDMDDSHGAEVYLETFEGTAIKDLDFKVLEGISKQVYFSKTIIFRFESPVILRVISNIIGDLNTSKVSISSVNLHIKRIHE